MITIIMVIIAIMDDHDDLCDHDCNGAMIVKQWLMRTIYQYIYIGGARLPHL